MDKILSFYNSSEKQIKTLIKKIFQNENWAKAFLKDSHHGFTHGNQVRLACLKLVDKLNPKEKGQLLKEGKRICQDHPLECALVSIEIAAIFHDCGRFNRDGKVVSEEQNSHHILGAKRAKIFCDYLGLSVLVPYIKEAIICHDFQSKNCSPGLNAPKTIIGKIVQSADQMGWFHPDSISRTLDFNKALGVNFFNPRISLKERLAWKPTHTPGDALTVMLYQLFGPTGKDRFGIESARQKVAGYKSELEKNIIKIAKKFKVEIEASQLIKNFKKACALQ
ncbi:MAG TPA: HD domain-containing protein [Patescibacteria group bacterium]|nr:HD domain-containing protein [Patescibacteria group bacterium]